MDVLSQEDLITYVSLVQEATREYRDLVDSKRWEPATSKENSQDQPSLPKAYTVVIEQSINKALKQVDSKIHRSGNGNGSEIGSSARSDITCYKCGKKVHIQKDCRPTINVSSGNTPKKSTNELPECVTKKPVVSDTKDMTTANTTATTRITSGAPLVTMITVHGDSTGRMAMRNGKLSKARSHLFVFAILP